MPILTLRLAAMQSASQWIWTLLMPLSLGMPDALGSGTAFRSVVAARCRLAWAPVHHIEKEVPIGYSSHMFRAKI
jgi:hypothetical protein